MLGLYELCSEVVSSGHHRWTKFFTRPEYAMASAEKELGHPIEWNQEDHHWTSPVLGDVRYVIKRLKIER